MQLLPGRCDGGASVIATVKRRRLRIIGSSRTHGRSAKWLSHQRISTSSLPELNHKHIGLVRQVRVSFF
jgi:hypothetical protein